jgi:hypothetical protein
MGTPAVAEAKSGARAVMVEEVVVVVVAVEVAAVLASAWAANSL